MENNKVIKLITVLEALKNRERFIYSKYRKTYIEIIEEGLDIANKLNQEQSKLLK